jgi:phage terminase large subunit GpA-like protein
MHKWHEMGPSAFAAEFQNEPVDESAESDAPHFRDLMKKLTSLPRGTAPAWANWIMVGVDIQKPVLMYVVLAAAADFRASVIEYGAWPQQARSYFRRREAHPTLQVESGSSQDEGAWFWGLTKLSEYLLHRRWPREGGGEMSVSQMIIDANGDASATVNEFCRRTPFAGLILPAYGRGIRAAELPMEQWKRKPGEKPGFNWTIRPGVNHAVRYLLHDVNFWKTFMARRAGALQGETGSLSIFGRNPEQHHMLAQHLAAETCQRTFGRGREVWEWSLRPGDENDWLDALVMAGVAASIGGASLETLRPVKSRAAGKPKSLSEMRDAARG